MIISESIGGLVARMCPVFQVTQSILPPYITKGTVGVLRMAVSHPKISAHHCVPACPPAFRPLPPTQRPSARLPAQPSTHWTARPAAHPLDCPPAAQRAPGKPPTRSWEYSGLPGKGIRNILGAQGWELRIFLAPRVRSSEYSGLLGMGVGNIPVSRVRIEYILASGAGTWEYSRLPGVGVGNTPGPRD
jgi:hypothetical protein